MTFPPLGGFQPSQGSGLYVSERFRSLEENILISPETKREGTEMALRVVSVLNKNYWNVDNDGNYSFVGSWGKDTAIKGPTTDIDVMFFLPPALYHQYNLRLGNAQSQLLQNVKTTLQNTYPRTDLRGDGQVVVVDFDKIKIEIVPAFDFSGRTCITCDTHDGGSWDYAEPYAEALGLELSDYATDGNTRKIVRFLKQWKLHQDVQIQSFKIERAVVEALNTDDQFARVSEQAIDLLVSRAFTFLVGRYGQKFLMPGEHGKSIEYGTLWFAKAKAAQKAVLHARAYEKHNYDQLAGEEWQKVFGPKIPSSTTLVNYGTL